MISYTWSKTLVEGDDGFFGVEGGVPQDPYNPRSSHGPAGFNIPQMFTANYVYDLPFGTGRLILDRKSYYGLRDRRLAVERNRDGAVRPGFPGHGERRHCRDR